MVSNPGGGLPLLEIFSRNTAQELRNCGYETVSRFGHNVTKEETRKLLSEQDIFLWEGHHSTLIKDFGFAEWKEPLAPSLVFLQSCLALAEAKVHPVLQRGAVAVAGSSTRMYSASGGALSLAFFNALLYENRPLGGSLRQPRTSCWRIRCSRKNAWGSAKMSGANLRAAWAFTLWGDPMLHLAPPASPAQRAAVRPVVRGNTIIVDLPDTAYHGIQSGDYRSQMRPNARLAGLLGATRMQANTWSRSSLPRFVCRRCRPASRRSAQPASRQALGFLLGRSPPRRLLAGDAPASR